VYKLNQVTYDSPFLPRLDNDRHKADLMHSCCMKNIHSWQQCSCHKKPPQ